MECDEDERQQIVEYLNVELVPLEELARRVLAGEIPDLKTQAAVMRAYYMLRTESPVPGVGTEAL